MTKSKKQKRAIRAAARTSGRSYAAERQASPQEVRADYLTLGKFLQLVDEPVTTSASEKWGPRLHVLVPKAPGRAVFFPGEEGENILVTGYAGNPSRDRPSLAMTAVPLLNAKEREGEMTGALFWTLFDHVATFAPTRDEADKLAFASLNPVRFILTYQTAPDVVQFPNRVIYLSDPKNVGLRVRCDDAYFGYVYAEGSALAVTIGQPPSQNLPFPQFWGGRRL